MLTHSRLLELLHYDAATGVFTRRTSVGRFARGTISGTDHCRGYRRLRVDGRNYLAHRLAWFYIHGRWPSAQVDHKNRDRADNRIDNLREASARQNAVNRAPRGPWPKGVYFRPEKGKWVAKINEAGKHFHIGYFTSPEAASAAYQKRALAANGEYARFD